MATVAPNRRAVVVICRSLSPGHYTGISGYGAKALQRALSRNTFKAASDAALSASTACPSLRALRCS
jgi:hypothetical protein